MDTDLVSVPATVIVVGGDAVVGQALELLLRSADYDVRFVNLDSFSAPRSLDGARLLLLGAGLGDMDRAAVLSSVGSDPDRRSIPVLELVAGAQSTRLGDRHFLAPWPCRPEDLERQIRTALLIEVVADKPGNRNHIRRREGTPDPGAGRGR